MGVNIHSSLVSRFLTRRYHFISVMFLTLWLVCSMLWCLSYMSLCVVCFR